MHGMTTQMAALDDFVARARAQNSLHRDTHLQTLGELTTSVHGAFAALRDEIGGVRTRVHECQVTMSKQTAELDTAVRSFAEEAREPLAELRSSLHDSQFDEYTPTGATPPRTTYEYPKILPRTESPSSILGRVKHARQPPLSPSQSEEPAPVTRSPSKTRVYHDSADEVGSLQPAVTPCAPSNMGLREVDPNVVVKQLGYNADPSASIYGKSSPEKDRTANFDKDDMEPPPAKRHQAASMAGANKPTQKSTRRLAALVEGRENVPISGARRLRNRPSNG
jgi:kinesin family member 11